MRSLWSNRALLLALTVMLSGARAAAEEGPADLSGLWSDPTFQKEFLGSYGFNADIEPGLDEVDRKQLQQIAPLLEENNLQEAAVELEKIVTPESGAILHFTLGNVYFQLDRQEEAIPHYKAAIEKFPSFRRAYKNLGMIYVQKGSLADAITPLGRVIQLGGGDGVTYGLLGYAYASVGQFVAAESAYRNALLLQPEVVQWRLGLTQALQREEKFEEAASLCAELLDEYPERVDLWLLQANAFLGLDKPLKAAQNFEIVDRLGAGTPAVLYTLGDIYVNEKLWDLAERAYQRAVDLDPSQPVDQPLRRVEALAQRDALEQADALLTAVKATLSKQLSDEEHKKLLKLEARIAVARGEGGDPVAVLEEIVRLDPLDGEALLLLGESYARQDDPERAIFYYERAASLEEFEADARVRHAQVLVGQARYGEAVPLLKRAQELRPRDDVGRYLEQVERIARAHG